MVHHKALVRFSRKVHKASQGSLAIVLSSSTSRLSLFSACVLGIHLLPNEFRSAVKYRLGAPIYEERKCPYCKTGSLDTIVDHADACDGRGDMIFQHDRLRNKIFLACSAANLSPICEQKNLRPETNSRPGGVFLLCWSAAQPAALDVTITSPLQPSIISNALRFCPESCGRQEVEEIFPTMCQHRCSNYPHGF